MSEALAKAGLAQAFSLVPTNLEEALKFSKILSDSDLVPKDYKGKPGNVLVAMQMGLEVGLQPLQALQNIAVINGRAAVWGDAMLALVKTHPSFEWIDEKYNPTLKAATCTVKRKGQPEQVRTFSEDEAKKARLWEKDIWKAYPQRMLQMRARAFALRDVFPDAIKGLAMAEEAQDIQELDVTPKPEPITTQPFQVPAMPKVEAKIEAPKAEAPKVVDAEIIETESSAMPKTDIANKNDYLKRITDIKNQHEGNNWLNKHYKEIVAHPDKEDITSFFKEKMEILLADKYGKEGTKEAQGKEIRNWEAELSQAESIDESNAIWARYEATNPIGPDKVKMRRVKDAQVTKLRNGYLV